MCVVTHIVSTNIRRRLASDPVPIAEKWFLFGVRGGPIPGVSTASGRISVIPRANDAGFGGTAGSAAARCRPGRRTGGGVPRDRPGTRAAGPWRRRSHGGGRRAASKHAPRISRQAGVGGFGLAALRCGRPRRERAPGPVGAAARQVGLSIVPEPGSCVVLGCRAAFGSVPGDGMVFDRCDRSMWLWQN